MKVKMAIYKNTKYDATSPYRSDVVEGIPEYLRLSEIVEVDFPELLMKDVNDKEKSAIEGKILAEKEGSMLRLKEFEKELLAIGSDS